MSDVNGVNMNRKIPCLIIKESTREEYEKLFLDKWPLKRLRNTKGGNAKYYYEFHTD